MIYLFYGEEKYELYKEVEKIKKSFESLEVGVNFFNITKENIARIIDIGVDYVSSGALTHSAPILDVSLKNLHALN